MKELSKTVVNQLLFLRNKTIPSCIRMRTNAEAFSITTFMECAARIVKPSDKILDAGAGSCRYKKYFSHAQYESTDKSTYFKHDFICSLEKIPTHNSSYDVIVCTQVLEHVEYPQKVINEFYRILKQEGKLFLTAPQGWGIHEEPYHFFNFTQYGLASLFKNAGFKIISIQPRGGIFWYLGSRIKTLPSYVFFQYLFMKNKDAIQFKPRPVAFILLPLFLLAEPLCEFFIPLFFFYLDRLDYKKDYTLGYKCYCIK